MRLAFPNVIHLCPFGSKVVKENRELYFELDEHEGHWETCVIIKGKSCKGVPVEKYGRIENLKKWVSWRVYFGENNP